MRLLLFWSGHARTRDNKGCLQVCIPPGFFHRVPKEERQNYYRPAWPCLKHYREDDASKPVLLTPMRSKLVPCSPRLPFRTLHDSSPSNDRQTANSFFPCHDPNNKGLSVRDSQTIFDLVLPRASSVVPRGDYQKKRMKKHKRVAPI